MSTAKKIKRITSAILSCLIAASIAALPGSISDVSAAPGGTMRDITTMEVVHEMGRGINLGNTFEATGSWIEQYGDGTPNAYETAWGSPTVTKELIQGYADEGFGVLRIPVAWSNMMDENNNYKINDAWLSRVTEVVDWTLDTGMYAIMNLHWDGGWLENLPDNHDYCINKYSAIWTQLSEHFKDYGDHLMFEAQNEELGWNNVWNQWSHEGDKNKSYGYVNEVNQKFVDIVRNSGGNNPKRHLLISGYNTDVSLTCDSAFKMPDDPAGRCAVSVHYYTPSSFAILEEDADWGKASSTWGTDAEVNELTSNMSLLKSTFVDKGVPVIIGEYGCPTNNKEPESVRKFISSVCREAYTRGMCPVLWDITDLHYSRTEYKIKDTQLKTLLDEIVSTEPSAPTEPSTPTEPPTQITTEPTNPTEPSAPTEPAVISGDINNDGIINIIDVMILKRALLYNNNLNEAADVNHSGTVDMADLVLIQQYLVKIITTF